jgi:sodium/hydrogen exchanger-like protein 6/7
VPEKLYSEIKVPLVTQRYTLYYSDMEPSHLPDKDPVIVEIHTTWALLILISLLIIILCVSYFLQRHRIQFIHESVISIMLGLLVGLIIRLSPVDLEIKSMLLFDHQYFFNLLLPPVILHSAYDLKIHGFIQNIGPILLFAFVGTFMSTMIIGVSVFLFALTGIHGLNMTFLDCVIFGAILSSTDPVTVLAIFKQLRVDPKLYVMVFGESILNDSVSIVLFGTLGHFVGKSLSVSTFFMGIFIFLQVFCGSCIIGVMYAIVCALCLKHTHLYLYPSIESCLIFLLAYSSYLVSNGLQLSGIVSLLFCGITLKHYAYPSMSMRTKRTTRYMFRVLQQFSENFIFIYLVNASWVIHGC